MKPLLLALSLASPFWVIAALLGGWQLVLSLMLVGFIFEVWLFSEGAS